MDDQIQQQNQQKAQQQSDQQSADQVPAQQSVDEVPSQQSTDEVQNESGGNVGGVETAPVPMSAQPEAQTQQSESGYERIKQIEKAAEGEGQKELAPKPKQPRPPVQKQKPKLTPRSIEKKEPPVAKPKYFGYQPPPSLAANTKYIKQNAGKGNAKDSQTWLLVFLDRLLKKEGERS